MPLLLLICRFSHYLLILFISSFLFTPYALVILQIFPPPSRVPVPVTSDFEEGSGQLLFLSLVSMFE